MLPPDWRLVIAAAGRPEIRARRAEGGTNSVKLTDGAVSMKAAIAPTDMCFLLQADREAA